MGITSNITSRDIEVNLSGNTLGTTGGQVLEDCLPIVSNISSLDLSDNGNSYLLEIISYFINVAFLSHSAMNNAAYTVM